MLSLYNVLFGSLYCPSGPYTCHMSRDTWHMTCNTNVKCNSQEPPPSISPTDETVDTNTDMIPQLDGPVEIGCARTSPVNTDFKCEQCTFKAGTGQMVKYHTRLKHRTHHCEQGFEEYIFLPNGICPLCPVESGYCKCGSCDESIITWWMSIVLMIFSHPLVLTGSRNTRSTFTETTSLLRTANRVKSGISS